MLNPNPKQENSCIKICFKRIFAILSNVICIIIACFKNSYSKEHLIKNIICNSLNLLDIFWKKIGCSCNKKKEKIEYYKLSTAEDDEDIRNGKDILKENENKANLLERLKSSEGDKKNLFQEIKVSEEKIQNIFIN